MAAKIDLQSKLAAFKLPANSLPLDSFTRDTKEIEPNGDLNELVHSVNRLSPDNNCLS
jgi:hypothetical protein